MLEYDTARAGGFEPLRFVPRDKTVVLGLISSKEPTLTGNPLAHCRNTLVFASALGQLGKPPTDEPPGYIKVSFVVHCQAMGTVKFSLLEKPGGDYLTVLVFVIGPTSNVADRLVGPKITEKIVIHVCDGESRPKFRNDQIPIMGDKPTGTAQEALAERTLETTFEVIDLYPRVATVGYIQLWLGLTPVNKDAVGGIEAPGLPLLTVDAVYVPAGPIVAVHIALAVAIGHPCIAIASVALFVDRNRCWHVMPFLVNRQIWPLKGHYRLAAQISLNHLTRHRAGTGRIFISQLRVPLSPIVREPEILGLTVFEMGDAVPLGQIAVPGALQLAILAEHQDRGVARVKSHNLARFSDRQSVMGPAQAGAFAVGNLGPVV